MSENASSNISGAGGLLPVTMIEGRPVHITFDGEGLKVADGQTILVAVLSHRRFLRRHLLDKRPLAGFCLMGACQECWIWLGDGKKVRACSTPVSEGMEILSSAPDEFPGP